MKCSICDSPIIKQDNILNAQPVMNGKCCGYCNEKIVKRAKMIPEIDTEDTEVQEALEYLGWSKRKK